MTSTSWVCPDMQPSAIIRATRSRTRRVEQRARTRGAGFGVRGSSKTHQRAADAVGTGQDYNYSRAATLAVRGPACALTKGWLHAVPRTSLMFRASTRLSGTASTSRNKTALVRGTAAEGPTKALSSAHHCDKSLRALSAMTTGAIQHHATGHCLHAQWCRHCHRGCHLSACSVVHRWRRCQHGAAFGRKRRLHFAKRLQST